MYIQRGTQVYALCNKHCAKAPGNISLIKGHRMSYFHAAGGGGGGGGGGDVHDCQCLSFRLCHTVAGCIHLESWFNNNLDANFRILSTSNLDTSVASVFFLQPL